MRSSSDHCRFPLPRGRSMTERDSAVCSGSALTGGVRSIRRMKLDSGLYSGIIFAVRIRIQGTIYNLMYRRTKNRFEGTSSSARIY